MSRFSPLLILIATTLAGIVGNILASRLDAVAGKHPMIHRLGDRRLLWLLIVLFIMLLLPAAAHEWASAAQPSSVVQEVTTAPSVQLPTVTSTMQPVTVTPTMQQVIATPTLEPVTSSAVIDETYDLTVVTPLSGNRYYLESSEWDGVGISENGSYLGVFRYRDANFGLHWGIHQGQLLINGNKGTITISRVLRDAYSTNSYTSKGTVVEGHAYYINDNEKDFVIFSSVGSDFYSVDNPRWNGVGVFDGTEYLGVFKYHETLDDNFKGIWGTHQAGLNDGAFTVHGTNLMGGKHSSFDSMWFPAP